MIHRTPLDHAEAVADCIQALNDLRSLDDTSYALTLDAARHLLRCHKRLEMIERQLAESTRPRPKESTQ